MPQKTGRESRERRKGREGIYLHWALKSQTGQGLGSRAIGSSCKIQIVGA